MVGRLISRQAQLGLPQSPPACFWQRLSCQLAPAQTGGAAAASVVIHMSVSISKVQSSDFSGMVSGCCQITCDITGTWSQMDEYTMLQQTDGQEAKLLLALLSTSHPLA